MCVKGGNEVFGNKVDITYTNGYYIGNEVRHRYADGGYF